MIESVTQRSILLNFAHRAVKHKLYSEQLYSRNFPFQQQNLTSIKTTKTLTKCKLNGTFFLPKQHTRLLPTLKGEKKTLIITPKIGAKNEIHMD